jgi:transposase
LPELGSFVKGIKQDFAAVKAGLTLEVSQGQVEGQVNRLKTIKREMFGRGKFDLLKAQVLHRSIAKEKVAVPQFHAKCA